MAASPLLLLPLAVIVWVLCYGPSGAEPHDAGDLPRPVPTWLTTPEVPPAPPALHVAEAGPESQEPDHPVG